MNDYPTSIVSLPGRAMLPTPTRLRWQPLRLGLVELFHYDSEEFWFRDGHLLLRGNNGTGKSKVLSLTLPFLLDAQLKPSRIEPDGDPGKRMAWNLLMNSYDRRIGYAWIEFGRIAEDGTPRYLSLGAGLSAAAARPQVESWFFVLDDDDGTSRINRDLWLTNDQRVVLTKERLRDVLGDHGQVFETAVSYRRAVDERLFHLGAKRYDALMDTLIQLRQPQLSKKPDETALSNALTEALPPLAPELLGDVAAALGQLEEDRRQLEEYQALAKAIDRFEQRYRVYAGTQSRRQARALRQTQTEFDNASRARTEAQARREKTEADEVNARTTYNDAELALTREQARLDTLRADPTMQDANRLENAKKEAEARRRARESAVRTVEEVRLRLQRSAEETQQATQRMAQAEGALNRLRREGANHANLAGLVSFHAESPLVTLDAAGLAELTPRAFDGACADLRLMVIERRGQIASLRRRHEEVKTAEDRHVQHQLVRDERQDAAETAAEQRSQADTAVEREGRSLIEAWEHHFTSLKQLQVTPDEGRAALTALAEWVLSLRGDNPARHQLQAAQQQTSLRLAQRRVALAAQRQTLEAEWTALEDERKRLEAGTDTVPPLPYTRDPNARNERQGAPLWQLVDFRETVTTQQRAGVEAALEAAGLLDAWVSSDGSLQTTDGTLLHDTQVLERKLRTPSLADILQAAVSPDGIVPARLIERILSGISCSDDDPIDCETWIASDGRFRLGALTGSWSKSVAIYIGYAARTAARVRRLAEIADRLRQLTDEFATVQAAEEQLVRDEVRASDEWRLASTDEPLRNAHLTAVGCAREAQLARDRLAQADDQCSKAQLALQVACERLATDSIDLRLPPSADALGAVEIALEEYRDTQVRLGQAAHELRLALAELQRQLLRESEARNDLGKLEEQLAIARIEAEEASVRFEVLRETVGAKVKELQQRLADSRHAVDISNEKLKHAGDTLRQAGEARAIAGEQAKTASTTLQQRSDARADAIFKFQQFATTGLLSAALPQIELPDMSGSWTIDPALTLARRTEQALSTLKDDDGSWARVQRQIAEELGDLQRALGALGQQASAETSDWGLVVRIIYQNRSERPDRLTMRLAQEITERGELLTAKERAVLENHLQAEIASEVQRLLQAAETQRDSINRELYSRPTSTGVRYRLLWQPMTEEEGAPVGLEAARKRLLNTGADLWSTEDRKVVGTMLQQRITAERERSDAGTGKDGSGSLIDQLARALDYRRWHRFRVERWQDGHWRKLSGPASSGERALGLTVPLFAAVASFYSQGSYTNAPRLMLLDEAFAGIDDAARAHCMGLIREFDLDFVITSEREWACYAELPGVAICQLQRREGIDAVFVSRWTWDGRAKIRQDDPDQRFAPP